MAASSWTTDDNNYYIWNGEVRIPKTFDPASKAAVIMLGPPGGVAQIPALVKGDPGKHAEIDSTIVLNALAYDDPTADSATWTTITPGDDTTSPVYRLTLNLHKGAPGSSGTSTVLTASDVTGTATDGYLLSKKVGSAQATWIAPKVGGQYWPATINNTADTDGSARTLCSVSISPAPAFDYRLRVHAQSVITSSGTSSRVDLIARVGNATSGDIVGRGFGLAGSSDRVILVSGVAAGSASTVGKISAGTATTVYLRAEQQASTNQTFTTSASTTTFMVEVVPIP
jgi:hypothetical protein